MTSEPRETTALLDLKADASYEATGYGNLTGGSIEEREERAVQVNIADVLDRMKYAILDPQYDAEADVNSVIQRCNQEEAEILLHALNSLPLPMRSKLNIHKQIRSGRTLKTQSNQSERKSGKKSQQEFILLFYIWESAITKISAYFGSNVASYFRFVRTVLYINLLMTIPLIAFIVVPEIIDGNFRTNVTFGGHFGDISDSVMFYGLYSEGISYSYNLPLAYMLTWLAVNIAAMVCILSVMTLRYRQSKLSEDQTSEYKFAGRTFCVWDHSITSHQGVKDHRISLCTDIKEIIREERQVNTNVSACTRCGQYVRRLVGNIIALALLVGSGLIIYYVANTEDILPDTTPSEMQELVQKYKLTATVAGLKFIVPVFFQYIVIIEGWQPRTETKITMARTIVFYIASLMVFVASLYNVANNKDCHLTNSTHTNGSSCCWENEVGEEVFKVILVDLGIIIAVGSIVHLSRALIKKLCYPSISYSTFDVVSCVLDVVYGQGLVWLGVYFSPLLPLLAVIKLVILFYFRYLLAMVAMVPPKLLFRASSTGNFYLFILLLYLFISLFPMAYAVIEFEPSAACGPFKDYDRPWRVVTEMIGQLPGWLEDGIDYLGTPAVLAPVIVLLVLLTIFFKVKSSSYKRLISELRKQLKFERKVEKRKIFKTGRNMSNAGLAKYMSQESLASNLTPGARRRRTSLRSVDTNVTVLLEEEENM